MSFIGDPPWWSPGGYWPYPWGGGYGGYCPYCAPRCPCCGRPLVNAQPYTITWTGQSSANYGQLDQSTTASQTCDGACQAGQARKEAGR